MHMHWLVAFSTILLSVFGGAYAFSTGQNGKGNIHALILLFTVLGVATGFIQIIY